ncbi:hypothetical protein LY78DRAFT_150677 [Colletotrichum sublineola]|nr:hypothetical protein LY78DRAFT_150677 [Colletotrichum sublineola]
MGCRCRRLFIRVSLCTSCATLGGTALSPYLSLLSVRVRLPSKTPWYGGHSGISEQARPISYDGGMQSSPQSSEAPGGKVAQAEMPHPTGVYRLFGPSHPAGRSLTTRDETFFFISFIFSLFSFIFSPRFLPVSVSDFAQRRDGRN